jgi:hypothetical protein
MNSDQELLASCREKCRNIEQEVFTATKELTAEQQFRTKARMPWYEYCQNSKEPIMTFKDFWGCDESYPRTIAST